MNALDLKFLIKPEILAQPPYLVKTAAFQIKLNQNESPWDWPDTIKQTIAERIQNCEWNRYPELIPEKLKVKLAERLGVDPTQIIVGNGSNEILQAVTAATLLPGDKVCLLAPTFAVYSLLAEKRGAAVLHSRLNQSFNPDEQDLFDKVQNSKLTIIANPNSPTGTLLSLKLIRQLANVSPGLVVIDEAYFDFSGLTAISLLTEFPNLIITRTFSKAFALAGFRIGYAVMDAPLAAEIQKCLLPFNVDQPAVIAAEILLGYAGIVAEHAQQIIKERDLLINELNRVKGVTARPSTSNFFLLETPLGPLQTFNGLMRQGILIRDVSSYPGCENMVRITVGTPEENQALLIGLRQIL